MDTIEITNLLYRYAEYIDSGDLAAAAELFRDARIKLYKDREPLTHEELFQVWKSAMIIHENGTPKTKHVITNPIIQVDRKANTATCRSYYTVLQATASLPLQVIASGRYHDEFVRVDGAWRYSFRDYSLHDATGDMSAHSGSFSPTPPAANPHSDNDSSASPTKAKILAAAQQAFSTAGYTESGIRKIADRVGLSSALVIRHFGSKAALFEAALLAEMDKPELPPNRKEFGRDLAESLANPGRYISSHSMTLLAIGNEEAREIVARVLQERSIGPLAEWLGPPNAQSRARQILALCAGFVLYNSQLTPFAESDPCMVKWLAQSLQAVVDQS